MAALKTSRPSTTQTVRLSSVLRPVAVAAGVLAAAATLPAIAHADPSTDPISAALGGAGLGGAGMGGAGNNGGSLTDKIAGIGQSICPSLVKPGATLASITSKLSGNSGLSPGIAGMVATMAIQMECPSMMTSLAHGQMPNMPFPMQMPGGLGGPSIPFQSTGANPLAQLHG
ncbi:hypothetical protein MNAB215_2026 [Mycobacterium numidiamassiliense]|uniref:DUF732 domain-containing protein n=1 Tax=Mycobacterium numidiamassiliense TaxID=1841861 RepID=A0A2U3P7U0_9MYCO|nr:DUF732 domain-containing protein [Mycobacterium numidiamassiliense]SPM39833.1 hypothetical protein MNAB215_2026 [Mycobacterium numidiamassiliense]